MREILFRGQTRRKGEKVPFIAAARGNERYDRFVANSPVLFDWGHNRNRENLERYTKLNPNRTVHDIQVIGNIHDNPDLLKEADR